MYWGDINTTVHKGFGISGALTNGVMRDLGDLLHGFPVVAGSIGSSHGVVHVREIDTPVSIFGPKVNPGDLIHADRHGALVLPEDLTDRLEDVIHKLLTTERIVLDAASQPGFDFQKFQSAWEKFEKSKV